MRQFIKQNLHKFFKTRYSIFFKRLIRPVGRLIEKEETESLDLRDRLANRLEVQTGIFKGMRYSELSSVGSALCPKLIGSYEKELQPVIERLLENNYSEILDIGCAEGYYAVGLAMKTGENTKLYAYDTDKKAIELCARMAKVNSVENKVILGQTCYPETLKTFKFTRGFILCDCEGYENELFNEENVKNLANCDCLIELHEFIIPEIRQKLIELFKASHDHTIIETEFWYKHKTRNPDDYKDLLAGINYETKQSMLEECRPCRMRWLVLERKK
jgi:SAM-dependent methyltransferase